MIIEIPYVLAQSIVYTAITYPLIGYYWSAHKVFWYLYSMFCTLLYYTYLGMVLIVITPSFPIAAVLQSAFYTSFNLFAGFLIPPPVSITYFSTSSSIAATCIPWCTWWIDSKFQVGGYGCITWSLLVGHWNVSWRHNMETCKRRSLSSGNRRLWLHFLKIILGFITAGCL